MNPDRLICGMTQETAQRYIVVRQEISLIINRLYRTGSYLSEFEKIKPTAICRTLSLMGRLIMHEAMLIGDYLENEFVSAQKVKQSLADLGP
jgi:hypothetical protein